MIVIFRSPFPRRLVVAIKYQFKSSYYQHGLVETSLPSSVDMSSIRTDAVHQAVESVNIKRGQQQQHHDRRAESNLRDMNC